MSGAERGADSALVGAVLSAVTLVDCELAILSDYLVVLSTRPSLKFLAGTTTDFVTSSFLGMKI